MLDFPSFRKQDSWRRENLKHIFKRKRKLYDNIHNESQQRYNFPPNNVLSRIHGIQEGDIVHKLKSGDFRQL